MKMQEIKQEVYRLSDTNNTQQLKKEHPDLTEGRDLRYKKYWSEILEKLKELQIQDLTLSDLEHSEQILKESLFKVGHGVGLTNEQLEVDWQRIKLEAQFGDVYLEEL